MARLGVVCTLGGSYSSLYGIAVDGVGNVYVADTYNNAVKKMVAVSRAVPASPSILTLGGTGFGTFGLTVDASGNVYVLDRGTQSVRKIYLPTLRSRNTRDQKLSQPHGYAAR